jgi:alpha-beta hydrolase superfamily lysophospholipase
MTPDKQHIEFRSQGFTLHGVLHLPDQKCPPLVVGSHGLEGSKNSAKQLVLSKLLPQRGIAFFRFDHRGCGQSQGDFIKETSLEKRTTDLVAGIQHLFSLTAAFDRIALFGSSMGGATCINAWERLTALPVPLCGAVLCSAPVKSRTIENIPVEATDKRPALPLSFFRDNLLFNITEKASNLHHTLIFHGDADDVVPVSNAHEIYARAQDPKRLIIHLNGDHQMTSKKDQAEFEKKTPAWFEACFKPSE